MPEPRGLGFVVRTKVDADHASDTVTRSVENQLLYIFYIMKLYHDLKSNHTYIFSHFPSVMEIDNY